MFFPSACFKWYCSMVVYYERIVIVVHLCYICQVFSLFVQLYLFHGFLLDNLADHLLNTCLIV